AVAEAAAVGRPDELKGQALVVFVSLRPAFKGDSDLMIALSEHVAKEIGKFARPDLIRFTDALPKTRSATRRRTGRGSPACTSPATARRRTRTATSGCSGVSMTS
ncbi:MAG TPA: hypothetical protein VGD55_08630, partial [Acidothermaceae bacterium]